MHLEQITIISRTEFVYHWYL